MTPARALALLLLTSCASAPELKPSRLAASPPSKPAVQAAPEPRLSVVPAIHRDSRAPNVKPVQYETTVTAYCRQVPLPATCVPPPSGEEAIFGMPKPPPPAPPPAPAPTPWYRWIWPFAAAGMKDSDPEKAARRDRPPKPNRVEIADENWQPDTPNAPRYLPCSYAGRGGPGPSRPEKAPSDWVRCSYRCGRYEVELNDMRLPKPEPGKTKDEQVTNLCEKWIKRAEESARSYDDALRRRGE